MEEHNSRPTVDQLRTELDRVEKKKTRAGVGRVLLFLLLFIVLVSVACLVLMPSFIVYGDSMAPTLEEGDMLLCWPLGWPGADAGRGDIVALHYNDRVLIKRIVAVGGDTVEILQDGTLLRDGSPVSETYAHIAPQGSMDTENPCMVPSGSYYVLGDNRANSVDSRNSIIGFVSEGQLIGKIFVRVWPLNRITLTR